MSTATMAAPRPASRDVRPLRWAIRTLAVLGIATAWSVVVLNTARGWPLGLWPLLVMASNATVGTGYICVGWLLVERRPRNLVGPLLLAFGVLWSLAAPCDLYLSQIYEDVDQADLPWAGPAALYMMAIAFPLAALKLLALVLFPTGRALSRWWVIVALAGGALGLVGVAALAFGSSTFGPVYPSIDSPFRVPGFPKASLLSIAETSAVAMSLFAVLAVAMRWYRGSPVERAQVKWVVVALAVIFVTGLVAEQLDDGEFDWPMAISGLIQSTSVVLLPLAIGIAILRYRLYEIDRIISRGVTYGLVSVILFAVFAGVNMVGTAMASRFLDEVFGTVSVAIATLFVAALFVPLRNRAQKTVDRRFHRSAYDAERVVDAFGGRMRDQVELSVVDEALRRTADSAFEPVRVGLWLAPPREQRATAIPRRAS